MEGLSCSFAFNGTSFICCINSIYFANKPPPSAHSRSHQNKAFALWFSSFHKKSPFRDFKIWDGRTTLAAPRVKRQFRVLLHVALPQSQKRSSLRSACAEPIKSLRFFTSRPYLQNKKRIRKIPILFLSGMEGLYKGVGENMKFEPYEFVCIAYLVFCDIKSKIHEVRVLHSTKKTPAFLQES